MGFARLPFSFVLFQSTDRMQKDRGPQLQIEFQEIVLTLTSTKKDSLKKIKCLKVKHAATGHVSESFENPTRREEIQEVKFDLRRKRSARFKLQLRHDANGQQNVNECGIELEVMRETNRYWMRETKKVTAAMFVVDDDRVGELIRRGVDSKSDKFSEIVVAYKVSKEKQEEIEMEGMGRNASEEDGDLGKAKFKPNSCIMVSFHL